MDIWDVLSIVCGILSAVGIISKSEAEKIGGYLLIAGFIPVFFAFLYFSVTDNLATLLNIIINWGMCSVLGYFVSECMPREQ